MNARSYKTVFSKRLGALVAVGEHATSQGKANGASGPGASGAGEGAVSALAGIGYVAALSASFAFVSLAWAEPATNALPTGGTVVQGAASMSQTASQMTINQGTQRAAINWQSFNIGAQAKVQVVQPNAQAVLLNRVVGQSPSQIFGKLQANGHVILVNPNGVLFGKDGSVNAGGFTASTLNISDANFMAGNMVYERNGSTAGIVNKGKITAEQPGGYVALLGATVSNEGSITTKGGSVVMGAGETIKVPVSGTGRIKLELTPAAINASLSNTGSIVTEGGQVYMQALALNRAAAQILQSGSIDTTGEKGGDVHVLADGGHIRVDGSITANSRNGTAGGDIIIGRDEVTGVLAKTTDVSNAKLESNKGFVETSGDWLATDGVSVKASEWLLDPSDITISSATSSNVTGTSPADITPDGGAGTSSIVQVSTIQNSINVGTNVTIKTTNSSNATGAGNIIIADKLTFTNTGAYDATLSLIADNGIFVNAGITATGTNLVHIDMLAKGQPNGLATTDTNFAAGSSSGIVLNNGIAISTNGTVKLVGTNNNTNANSRGITFNSGSSIKAASFDIIGTANGFATGSHGVHMVGNNTFTSSSTTVTSQINGISNSNGFIPGSTAPVLYNGITAATNINGNVTFDAGNGSMIVKGSNTSTQLGVRVSEGGGATAVKTRGEVTLGALEDNSGFSMRTGSITAETGNLKIRGQSGTTGVSIIGDSALKTNADGANIDIVGVANTSSGQFGRGVIIERLPTAPKLNAMGSINIEGSVKGTGTGSGVVFAKMGWGTYAVTMDAGRDITILANNQTTSSNNEKAMFLNAGLQAKAVGNITLKANTNSEASTAIHILSEVGKHPWYDQLQPLTGNTSLQSTGDGNILIQTNQGGIIINNSAVKADATYLVPTPIGGAETTFKGKNITIDNTDGHFNTQGAFTAGTGKASNVGVQISDARAITAAGNLNIAGASIGGVGINTNGVLTAKGDVNLTGTSAGTALAVYSTGAIESTEGGVSIKGTNTNTTAAGGGGTTIQGAVTAKKDITLEGYSSNLNAASPPASAGNQGLVIQNVVTSTDGNITVKGETKAKNQKAVAIAQLSGPTFGSLITAGTNKTININADTLYIEGTGGVGASVNAGSTGTVNIKTFTANKEIFVGMADNLNNQKLGVDNAELKRITAGNLVIGDTTSAGSITVTGPVTTTAAMGHITLKTNGAIAIDQKLEVDASKTLTLIAGTTVSDDNTNGIIKASQLELLGDAAVTLDSKLHEVGKLAADVKSLEFKNRTALAVDMVTTMNSAPSGTVGIKAKDGASVTTETGDLILNQSISNSTSGNVVVGAGVSEGAGSTVLGDVKRPGSATVTNIANSGKVFVYSGSAANTGLLSGLNAGFNELKVTGDATQNAETNTAFVSGNGISINGTPSTANAQVIFREKVKITKGLVGTKVETTYGETNTQTDANGVTALLTDTKNKLKQELGNSVTASVYDVTNTSNVNTIKIAKSVIIDSLDGTLPMPATDKNSSGSHINAKEHIYGSLTSNKYTIDGINGDVKVNVKQKALTGSISAASSIYGATLAAGSVTLRGQVGSDQVTATGVNIVTTGNTSSSGNLKAGSYTGIQTVAGLGDADAANYTFANVKGDYEVKQKTLTIDGIKALDKIYDGDAVAKVNTDAVTKGGLVGADVVTISSLGTFRNDANTADDKNVKLVGGVATTKIVKLNNSYDGKDLGNYKIEDQGLSSAVITQREVIMSAAKTYDGGKTLTGSQLAIATGVGTETLGYSSASINSKDVKDNSVNFVEIVALTDGANGGKASNYKFTAARSDNNKVELSKASLSVTLADQTKIYDGNTTATLTPNAFTAKGVQTEGASINLVSGNYNDKNVVGANYVTASLVPSNFVADTGTDLNNYNLPTTVTGKGTITPRPLTIAVGTVADKPVDGTTTAAVTPGALSNLVAGESLGVSATGNFSDANVGNGKVVTASYTLRDGTNGLASNYMLNANTPNPDSRLRGNILAAVNPVTPIAPVNNNTGSFSRVRTVSGFGGAGAATGVLDDKAVTESREVCSDVFPENCECQPSVIPSIEICFAPKSVAATKEEK